MRISIFEWAENPETDKARCHRSKSLTSKLVEVGIADSGRGFIRLHDGYTVIGIKGLLCNPEFIAWEPEQTHYPEFHFDPTLSLLPALRYPLQIASQIGQRKRQTA